MTKLTLPYLRQLIEEINVAGPVPSARTITVNGTTYDLSANRTFTVTDANLSTSDVTTNDVSTSKHGFVPKAPNDTTKFLRGDGTWAVPPGGGISDGDTLSTGLTFPNTGLHVLDTDASHDLILKPGSNLTADRTLTITTGDSDRTLTMSGNADISGTNTGDDATNSTSNTYADGKVSDTAYDATSWNGVTTVAPSKNAVRDKIESMTGYYQLFIQCDSSSPAASTTYYWGNQPNTIRTTAAVSKIYIQKPGTITIAELYVFCGAAGSNENWTISIRLNNTTDTSIASVAANTQERIFSNTGLSIAVVAGDYIEIKTVTPAWVTAPTGMRISGYIGIQYTL